MSKEEFEEFKKELLDKKKEYFENNFMNKPFYEAIYESSRKAILHLVRAYVSFIFLKDSLFLFKKDRKFFKKLEKEDKKTLNIIIKSTEYMIIKIEEILFPLIKGQE